MAEYVKSPSSSAALWRETFGSPLDLSKCRTKKTKISSELEAEKSEKMEEPEKSVMAEDLGDSESQKVDNENDVVCQPSTGGVSI